MFLNLRNNWPHNAVYKARNGTYWEGDCTLNILVSICITVMASSHEVNMNVHMHAHTLGFCCFRCRFLPLSFIISWAGYTQRKERRGMRVFGSPLCHHGPTYRMCHLQRMSFCPPHPAPLCLIQPARVMMGCNTPREMEWTCWNAHAVVFSFFSWCVCTWSVIYMVNTNYPFLLLFCLLS